ncbi:MAG: hypothetical protein GY904_30290 [Planctomycetaceae bacterium]|nr:hypothetical protein [Planctomycetaceae bacterium]
MAITLRRFLLPDSSSANAKQSNDACSFAQRLALLRIDEQPDHQETTWRIALSAQPA